jgi:hypothetical protein
MFSALPTIAAGGKPCQHLRSAPKAAFICGDVKLELLIFESSLDLLTNDYELIKLRILFK